MSTDEMIVVLLDNEHIGAGPATVIARVASVKEYRAMATDRDGARIPRLRLWRGEFSIGQRVKMKQLICGTGKGVFVDASETLSRHDII